MDNKKGAATLYIVVGVIIFLSIMTYVFSITSNLEIDMLTYFEKIKNEYEINSSDEKKKSIILQLNDDIKELNVPASE